MNKWGIFGTVAILLSSSVRLAYESSRIFYKEMYPRYWLEYSCTCLFFLICEGRSLHKNFTPFVVEKSKEIKNDKVKNVLAPLYCMGFFEKRAWICATIIACLSIGIGYLPFVCKMTIDAGVSLALFAGCCSLIYRYYIAL